MEVSVGSGISGKEVIFANDVRIGENIPVFLFQIFQAVAKGTKFLYNGSLTK